MEVDYQSGDCTTLEGLKDVISKQEEEIESLKNKIEELLKYSKDGKIPFVEELKTINAKNEEHIVSLKSEINKLNCKLREKENALLTECKKCYQKKIEDLEENTSDLKYENKCLRACLLPLSPQADNAALLEIEIKNNSKLEAEVKKLNKKLEDQNYWQIENSEVYQELRRQYNVLEAKNDEQQYVIQSLLETDKRLRNTENDLTSLHETYQQTLHTNNIVQSEMEAQIQQFKELAKETEQENFLLKEKLRESKSSFNSNAADKILYLEEKVLQIHEEKKQLEGKLSADKEKLGSILARLEQSIRFHKKEKSDLLTEIDKLQIKVCELQGANISLEANLEEKNQMIEGVTNNKIIQLQNEIAFFKTDKMLLEERLNAFNKQHDDIIAQIKGCAMKQVEAETEIIQLQANLNKELHSKSQLEYQLAESRENISDLKDSIRKRTSELEKEMHQLKAKNIVFEKERDLVVCENNELTLRIADLQKNATRLNTTCSKIETVNKENAALRNELEVMKKQFQGKITNARIIIQQVKSENASLKTQINDLIKTMKVEDNIDLLVQDRLIEKKGLHEKIQQLETKYHELEIKYNKCKDEFAKQSTYFKERMEEQLIEKNTEIATLQDDNNKNLTLAKVQYDKDIQFIRGRHNEAIMKLQAMHEENIKEKVIEHQTEVEDLRAQKQAYREALRKIRREVEELRDQLSTKTEEHNHKIEEMKKMFDADRKRSTENIARLAKKCWIELEKIQVIGKENQYLQEKAEKELLKKIDIEEIQKKLEAIQLDDNFKEIDNNTEKIDVKEPNECQEKQSESEVIKEAAKNTKVSKSEIIKEDTENVKVCKSVIIEKIAVNTKVSSKLMTEIEPIVEENVKSVESTVTANRSRHKSLVYMISNVEKSPSSSDETMEEVELTDGVTYITVLKP